MLEAKHSFNGFLSFAFFFNAFLSLARSLRRTVAGAAAATISPRRVGVLWRLAGGEGVVTPLTAWWLAVGPRVRRPGRVAGRVAVRAAGLRGLERRVHEVHVGFACVKGVKRSAGRLARVRRCRGWRREGREERARR